MENQIQKIYQRHDISIARKEKEEKELYEKLKAKYENGTGI